MCWDFAIESRRWVLRPLFGADVFRKDVPEISEVTASELKGRHANKSTKDKSKVALVAKTNLQTQLRDWHVSGSEQHLCFRDAKKTKIGNKGVTRNVIKKAVELPL